MRKVQTGILETLWQPTDQNYHCYVNGDGDKMGCDFERRNNVLVCRICGRERKVLI